MKKYYKYIIVAIVIIGIAICIKSCMDRKESDLTVAYIGDGFVNRTLFEENISHISSDCADITGDGEFYADIMEISFNEELNYADKQNSEQKKTNAVGMGMARLYFIDKSQVLKDKDKGVFADISALGTGIKNAEGKTVAISLEGNKKLAQIGIEPKEDIYLAIRIVTEVDELTDKNIGKKDANAWAMAKSILN